MPQRFSSIPSKPGIYLFKDSKQRVLYVGKAKNLRNRIRSYFRKKSDLDPRKASMMKDVEEFSYIITGNELEAFVLEANLIKQYKPRFNIILRDDKNYPYLKLNVHEDWPGIEVVRKITRDGALYFGPYVPAGALRDILAFIRKNFQIRDCRLSFEKPVKHCIQHQMGRCIAPCAGYISREEYAKQIDEIRLFLRGEKKELIAHLEKRMLKLSEEMRYEEAAGLRDRIRAIGRAMESQRVVAPELHDLDVIGFHQEGNDVQFTVMFIRNGFMIGSKNFRVNAALEFPGAELLHVFIMQFYSMEIIPPAEILTPVLPEDARILEGWLGHRMGKSVKIRKPVKGKKRELVGMAIENAGFAFREKRALTTQEIVTEIRERLNLPHAPGSIGDFDISNITLGRMVVQQRPTSQSNLTPAITRWRHDGLAVTKTDALGRTSTRHFDVAGNVVTVVDPGAADTDYEYDAFGNLTKVRDFYGTETSATYDVRGFRTGLTDPDAGRSAYTYFPTGEVKTQANARGQVTSFTYDRLSRPIQRAEPEGVTTWTWGTSSTSRNIGALAAVASPGFLESYQYDSYGRPASVSTNIAGATLVSRFAYDTVSGLLDTFTYPPFSTRSCQRCLCSIRSTITPSMGRCRDYA